MSKSDRKNNKLNRKREKLARQIRRNNWAHDHNISLPQGPFINPLYTKYKKFKASEPKKVDVKVFGNPIPLSYGTFRTACDVIWATAITPITVLEDDRDEPFKEKWSASFAVKVCDGEQGSLLRVWFNKILVYDFKQGGGDHYSSHPNFAGKLVFYPGSETQTVNPTIEVAEGAGNVQAFRGTCYIVFKDIPLAMFGDEIPNVEAEIASAEIPDTTTFNSGAEAVDSAADIEKFFISRASGFVYRYNGNYIKVIRRRRVVTSLSIPISDYMDSVGVGWTIGNITVDEKENSGIEPIYLIAKISGKSFIVKYDSNGFIDNYLTVPGTPLFETIFVRGDSIFLSDGTNSKIYCFNKSDLSYNWMRSGPVGTFTSGNFTVDKNEKIFTVWFDSGDPDTIHISKITRGGVVKHDALPLTLGGCTGIIYDTFLDRFITGGVDGCYVYSLDNYSDYNDSAINSSLISGNNCHALFTSQYQVSKSSYFVNGTNIYKIRNSDLSVAKTYPLADFADTGTGNEAYAFGFTERAIWINRDASPGLSKLPLDRYESAAENAEAIISDLCLRAGLSAADIDAADYASFGPLGFVVNDRATAREPLDTLLTAFQGSVREHYENGYAQIKLEFILRSAGASVATITEDKIGVGEEQPEDQSYEATRVNEESLPLTVIVKYADSLRSYDNHVQKSSIPPGISAATREMNLDLESLALSNDFAKQLADSTMAVLWAENENVFFTLGVEFLYLEKDDVITAVYNGISYTLRIEEIELGANLILEIFAVVTNIGAYVFSTTGSAGLAENPEIEGPGGSLLVLIDCPAVRDIDGMPGEAGIYAASAPVDSDSSWIGSKVSRSGDGLAFARAATFSNAATIGTTTTALNSGDTEVFDSGSLVNVKLLSGSLSSQTEGAIRANPTLNLCAIGTETGGWELIQFKTVTHLGDGIYELTGMYRGRFGTDNFIGSHASGETLVLLDFDTPTIRRIKIPLSDRYVENIYRCYSIGAPISNSPAKSFSAQFRCLEPFSPRRELISGVRHSPAANDWSVNFRRRSRIGFELQNLVDVAINEEAEEYEIDIKDGLFGRVLRTITVGPGLPTTTGVNLAISAGAVTRASGSFLTDGFLLGQLVDLEGWSNSANNQRFKVTAISALSMSIGESATEPIDEASASGRTVTAATPAFLYSAAMQAADGGSKSAFYATIYQISQTLRTAENSGRGTGTQLLIS